MTKFEYEEYRQGEWWRNFSAEVRRWHGKCAHCGFGYELNVHHLTYERLGRERFSDVIVLCRACHSREHFKDNLDSIPDWLFVDGSKTETLKRLNKQQEEARQKNISREEEREYWRARETEWWRFDREGNAVGMRKKVYDKTAEEKAEEYKRRLDLRNQARKLLVEQAEKEIAALERGKEE